VTKERCWGSIAGEFRFKKTASWEAKWCYPSEKDLRHDEGFSEKQNRDTAF